MNVNTFVKKESEKEEKWEEKQENKQKNWNFGKHLTANMCVLYNENNLIRSFAV